MCGRGLVAARGTGRSRCGGWLEGCAVGAGDVPEALVIASGVVAVAVLEQVVVSAHDAGVGGVGRSAVGVTVEVIDLGDCGSDRASEPDTSRLDQLQDVSHRAGEQTPEPAGSNVTCSFRYASRRSFGVVDGKFFSRSAWPRLNHVCSVC